MSSRMIHRWTCVQDCQKHGRAFKAGIVYEFPCKVNPGSEFVFVGCRLSDRNEVYHRGQQQWPYRKARVASPQQGASDY